MNISQNLVMLLKKSGKTQKELAEQIGAPTSTVNNWIKLNRSIPAEYIIPICEFVNVSPYFFLTGQEKCVNNENEVGRTSPPLTSEEYDEDRRDKEELIDIFNNLSEREKGELMGYARHMYYQANPETKENA